MSTRVFHAKAFWLPAITSCIILGTFFAWELSFIPNLPGLPRPAPTQQELYFIALILILFSLNAGLLGWQAKHGACPIGAKRATSIGGVIGAITILCPMCLLIPLSLFGLTISLAFLSPFLPLLRIIALVLLGVSTWLLWPTCKK